MINSYEFLTVQGDFISVDLLTWRRYKSRAPGILELTLDKNPHLAKHHKTSPFLPVGTQLRIPIDIGLLRGIPKPRRTITIFGKI